MRLSRLQAIAAAAVLALPAAASAQTAAPEMPALNADQSAQVQQQIAAERRTTEARVARGEVTPDEAERYLAWREWQIARQVAGLVPPPQQPSEPPARYGYRYPAPYGPPPYYGAPRYYYGGPVVCAGGWGSHVAGRVCF
jgi:hypothetical protein